MTEPTYGHRMVKRSAKVCSPVVVTVAITGALFVPWIAVAPIAPWFERTPEMIPAACPGALLVASPVAIVAAIRVA